MKTVFVKYSNERSDSFSIKTIIEQDESGKRYVKKLPLTDEAVSHVKSMLDYGRRIDEIYSEGGFFAAPVSATDNGVTFEYIVGESVEDELEKEYGNGNFKAVIDGIADIRDRLMGLSHIKPFERTEGFDEIFGLTVLPDGLHATEFSCMDLALGNLIVNDKGINIIDYEWCFNFPIPVEYILYRAIKLFVVLNNKADLIEKDIFAYFGFDKQLCSSFDAIEEHFQDFIKGTSLNYRELYNKFGQNFYSVENAIELEKAEKVQGWYQVYFDYGEGFSEADSYRRPYDIGADTEIDITLTSDVKACRLDPCDNSCIMLVRSISAWGDKGMYAPKYTLNGCESHGSIYFTCDDPQILFENLEGDTKHIQIKVCILEPDRLQIEGLARAVFDSCEKDKIIEELKRENKAETDRLTAHAENLNEHINMLSNEITNLSREIDGRNSEIISLNNKIDEMENTMTYQREYIANIENSRLWKTSLAIRKLLGRNR